MARTVPTYGNNIFQFLKAIPQVGSAVLFQLIMGWPRMGKNNKYNQFYIKTFSSDVSRQQFVKNFIKKIMFFPSLSPQGSLLLFLSFFCSPLPQSPIHYFHRICRDLSTFYLILRTLHIKSLTNRERETFDFKIIPSQIWIFISFPYIKQHILLRRRST